MRADIQYGTQTHSEAVASAADILRLIANPNRLAILFRLSEGETSVGEMEAKLAIRQPTLSQQIGELRKAGLIDDRRDGKTVFYRLIDHRAQSILERVHDLFIGERKLPADHEVRRVRGDREPAIAPSFYASVFARVLESGPLPH